MDEVGYIPFDPEAAALFFALVSSRYERASMIVNSNKTFSAWAEIFGDPVAVAAMVDRLVHHAEVIALKGDSSRLKDRDLGRVPAPDRPTNKDHLLRGGSKFNRRKGVNFRAALTVALSR
jgi:hypothetical protein